MQRSTPTILCFGEILWDIFHDETSKTSPRSVLGGAPSNLCYFFNMLGEQSLLVSQVGKDELGQKALAQIKALHIPHLISQSKTLPTGKVDIVIQNNEPTYTFNTPAAWDEIPYSEDIQKATQTAEIIAFGSLASRFHQMADTENSFSTLKKILTNQASIQPRSQSALRFLDLNLRTPFYDDAIVLELLKFADILKINETEFHYLKNLLSLNELSTRDALYALIIQLRLNYVILTLGENGSIVMSENDYSALSAKKINNPNTVGAGDGFSAGFITALNRGASFAKAHHFANELSAYICTQEGAFIDIPHTFIKALNSFEKW